MSSQDFKYSKLKNLRDVNFYFENFKRNEFDSFSCQTLEELQENKENVLSLSSNSIKEYIRRVKLEKVISALFHQLTASESQLSELRKRLQSRKEEKESGSYNRDIESVTMYEHNLAIRTEPASLTPISEEVAVSFDFHNINESNPQETCSFVLIITGDNMYKATNCQPPIAEMDMFISTLNATDDLHKFIVNVRKKFQAYFLKAF